MSFFQLFFLLLFLLNFFFFFFALAFTLLHGGCRLISHFPLVRRFRLSTRNKEKEQYFTRPPSRFVFPVLASHYLADALFPPFSSVKFRTRRSFLLNERSSLVEELEDKLGKRYLRFLFILTFTIASVVTHQQKKCP